MVWLWNGPLGGSSVDLLKLCSSISRSAVLTRETSSMASCGASVRRSSRTCAQCKVTHMVLLLVTSPTLHHLHRHGRHVQTTMPGQVSATK